MHDGELSNYQYDALKRLTSAAESFSQNPSSGSGYGRTFGYDVFGNMSLSTHSNVPLSGLTPVTGQGTINTANNRLTYGTYGSSGELQHLGSSWLAYDAENRQTQVSDTSVSPSQLTVFTYDAQGNRVQKLNNNTGAKTVYVHDAFGQLAAEYSSVAMTPACNTCYLTYDQLGSVRLVTNESGGVVVSLILRNGPQ